MKEVDLAKLKRNGMMPGKVDVTQKDGKYSGGLRDCLGLISIRNCIQSGLDKDS